MSTSPAAAILALSRLAAGKLPCLAFVQHAGDILFDRLLLERVVITIRHPETKEVLSIERERSHEPIRLSEGYVLIAEDILLRGVRIGRIEVHSARGGQSGAAVLQLAESAAEQVARYLDLDAQRIRNAAHLAKLETLKTVTQATEIIAAQQGVNNAGGLRWLMSEAVRHGRGINDLAHSIIRKNALGRTA